MLIEGVTFLEARAKNDGKTAGTRSGRARFRVEGTSMKVTFLSEKSVLDLGSGAAIEILTWLRYLVQAGHACSSFTFSCFDGQDQYPVKTLVSKEIDVEKHAGRLAKLTTQGIEHNIQLVKSTRTEDLNDNDFMTFHANAKKHIDEFRPDVIISFGSKYLEPLIRFGQKRGAHAIFYLGTASYNDEARPVIDAVNKVIVPTRELKKLYKKRFSISKISVVPTAPSHSFERSESDIDSLVASRREKFITLINPAAAKGGLIFMNIAHSYQNIDPSIVFLAVESRGTRQDWIKAGLNVSEIKNLWWIPKQSSIGNVFRRTSILVVPSIGYEAAGKVISEAMVCGIPVIGTNSGGIPEQMRGAGHVIELPDDVVKQPNTMPASFVNEWVEAVRLLLDDEAAYRAAALDSLKEGHIYRHKRRARDVVALLESVV